MNPCFAPQVSKLCTIIYVIFIVCVEVQTSDGIPENNEIQAFFLTKPKQIFFSRKMNPAFDLKKLFNHNYPFICLPERP